MSSLSPPPASRVSLGFVVVAGQRQQVYLDPEWARYLESLNTQVVITSNAVGQPGAPGTTGAAGAGVSLGPDGDSGVEFIPGPAGQPGAQGAAGLPLFLLQEPPESQDPPARPTLLNEAFIAPTLLNSWANFDVTTYNSAGYYKDSTGIVHLRGLVMSGVVGSPIFNLPAGYRPAFKEVFACASNNAFGRLDVTAAGDVTLVVGSNLFAGLDGITFRAAGTY